MHNFIKTHTYHTYFSIILYVLFIFLTQWSLTAAKTDLPLLAGVFSILVNYIVLPSIVALAVYGFIANFHYYAKHKWFTLSFIFILCFVAISSRSISLTLPLLVGLSAFGASTKLLARYAVISLGTLLLVSCALSVLGLNGGDTMSKPLFGVDDYYATTATALGLSNPNSVMLIFFNIIALSLLLCVTQRQVIFTSIALFILTIYFSVVTGSTTGLVIGLITLTLVSAAKHRQKTYDVIKRITPWMFLFVTIVTFAISVGFGSSDDRQNDINNTLTGRPYLWNLRIENNSYINIYGQNDQYPQDVNYPLDNMPLYILVNLGFGVYLVFMYIFYRGSKSIKDPEIIAYVFAATLLMFTEKIEMYGFVLIFLQKAVVEHSLMSKRRDT